MLKDYRWYRKLKGGTWYYVEYTYKRDMGMTRVTEFEWFNEKEAKKLHTKNF